MKKFQLTAPTIRTRFTGNVSVPSSHKLTNMFMMTNYSICHMDNKS